MELADYDVFHLRVCMVRLDLTIFGFGGFDLALWPFEVRIDSGPILTEWISHSMGCEHICVTFGL